MIFKGIQKTSLIDYPGNISTVLFVGGCNMRCPFCQNPDLVLRPKELPDISEEYILSFLKERRQWLDGVCITGGEPLLYEDMLDFIKKVKQLNLRVKLDTNGLNPKLLRKIIDEKIVDYIAMDIKSHIDHYDEASGIKVDINKIKESVELIKNSRIEYEFRSTIVPDFFNEEIVVNIGKWLRDSKKYALQQFRSSVSLVDKSFEGKKPYDKKNLERFKEIMEEHVQEVEIRA